jgi:hypothetical protein|tara:strand:- start:566 stop:718 length:153 start_codon:yes stop_codon:yes gene_type:complete
MKKRPYKFYDTWDNPFAVKSLELQDKIHYMRQVIILLSIVNVVLLGVIIL